MIEFVQEPILKEQDKALRLWLVRPECGTIKRIVDSKVKLAQVEALRDLHTVMRDGNENYNLKANDKIRQAHRYQTFLDVLEEITSQSTDEIHQIVKLK